MDDYGTRTLDSMWSLVLAVTGIGIAVVALSVHALRRDGAVRRRLDTIEQTLSVVEQAHATGSSTDEQQPDAGTSPPPETPNASATAEEAGGSGGADQAARFLKDTSAAFASSPVATAALIVAGAATALLGVGQLPSGEMHGSTVADPMPTPPMSQSPAPVAAAPVAPMEETPDTDDEEPASDKDDTTSDTGADRQDAVPPPRVRTPGTGGGADPAREGKSDSEVEETPPAERPDEEMLCGKVTTNVGTARACVRDPQQEKSTLI